ncbi:hypothetical protein X474_27950 [Dethiosulfatarculus sandiegensis]|uniref:Uncharacterized protein n=1 Tax=Dethiosulfatarculus sandiegensis TaxID=1429043 RepID=A0A0D2JMU0_9BACT|nr:hypothetical protein X474_27950 [Dethiosulfatarculus sandiegensis]
MKTNIPWPAGRARGYLPHPSYKIRPLCIAQSAVSTYKSKGLINHQVFQGLKKCLGLVL